MFDKMQILQLFTHLYMLIRSTFSLDRPPAPPSPYHQHHSLHTILKGVMKEFAQSHVRCIFNKGCQEVGCGGGRGLLFKRHIKQNGTGSSIKDVTNDFDVLALLQQSVKTINLLMVLSLLLQCLDFENFILCNINLCRVRKYNGRL